MSNIDASKFTYVQFCAALVQECADLGLPAPLAADTETGLPQNEGYCFLRFSEGGAAIIIPKGKTRMAPVHSHVDLSAFPGFIPLPKKNGRVICHFAADVGLLSATLQLFVGASKRPLATPVKATPVTTPVTTPVLASVPSYTDQDLEEIEAEMFQNVASV